jgi:hypothetical protein
MKRLAFLLLVLAGTGCYHAEEVGESTARGGVAHGHPELGQFVYEYYTPEMKLSERDRKVARAWDWEGKQFADDIDHVLLLRPPSRLTIWNLR